ncbi:MULTISPECIES: reverse transcriptase domain-containing protein [unclassified Sulfurimonas]|uniref:RNA-directed DNA polymerase n=1 Tax=unclassified Sulfurimonas TaxID=2623549 RepID=UPI000A79F51D|nr:MULTISPECIES: reverse transcriptase domain-containing protein [unclassified Sulfurimonas]
MEDESLFTKKDLYIAYKKVKFELFNDKNTIATLKLYEYEKNLNNNIDSLFEKIKDGNLLGKDLECKGFFEIPKSFDSNSNKYEIHFFSSSLKHHDFKPESITLKFRKVIDADIDFHIISALWILKIGQFIDEKFDANIYGSRLTRIKPVDTSSCEYDLSSQKYNEESPKIFESYHHKYQAWRNNSFKAIRELHKTSSVVAVTMDITSFYHSIELNGFKEVKFYEKFSLDIKFKENPKLKQFHESFIGLLALWNNAIESENGLPIGLSASSVLANAVMKDFDTEVTKNLAPTYYGRYVDDILLVFPDNGNLNSGKEIIEYFINKDIVTRNDNKILNKLKWTDKVVKLTTKDYQYQHEFRKFNSKELKYKNLILKESKQKIFYLDKNADLSIIDGIEAEINSISSEWRFLPDIADENSSLLQKVVGFYADGKEFNDALRKIDATTIKRLGLSLLVSHSHSLNQYISPKNWIDQRLKIYDLIENHIFIPKNLFENYTFLPRIFALMIHSGDGERAYCFLQKIDDLMKKFKDIKQTESSNKKDVIFEKFGSYYLKKFQEVFFETYNIQNTISGKYFNKIKELLDFDIEISKEKIEEKNSHLIMSDLGFDSYSKLITEYILTKNDKSLFKTILDKQEDVNCDDLDLIDTLNEDYLKNISDFHKQLLEETKQNDKHLRLNTLIFSTRLFTPLDISIVLPDLDSEKFINLVNSLRGTRSEVSDKNKKYECKLSVVEVRNKKLTHCKSVDVAITNFEVKDEYWKKSVREQPIKNLDRFITIQHMVNEAVRKKPNYLIFPELSMPQEWAWFISQKLLANNISLITGVEYIHTVEKTSELNQKIVHNSIMMFLISDNIGFNYMKYFRQDKLVGAYLESIELKNIANIDLKPDDKHKEKKIYKHGDFYFSSLICNELTDIENRFDLRGNIDCLFAIEWNRDIKSFNALVESSSLDIHSYIVQVNNRNYGDSRIRAPYKDDWDRDVVQVRGGKHDYLIVGEINIEKLREFQSHNISPNKDFKPVPTGFKMLKERKKWDNNQ